MSIRMEPASARNNLTFSQLASILFREKVPGNEKVTLTYGEHLSRLDGQNETVARSLAARV